MMDGTTVNVDVTAPGAMIALGLMFLKVILTCEIMSRLPHAYDINKIY